MCHLSVAVHIITPNLNRYLPIITPNLIVLCNVFELGLGAKSNMIIYFVNTISQTVGDALTDTSVIWN